MAESLHELGHSYGLVHHSIKYKTDNGKLCPMSVEERNDCREYVDEIIDQRDSVFCNDCGDFLHRYYRF